MTLDRRSDEESQTVSMLKKEQIVVKMSLISIVDNFVLLIVKMELQNLLLIVIIL